MPSFLSPTSTLVTVPANSVRTWFAKENWAALLTWAAFSFIQLRIVSSIFGTISLVSVVIALSLVAFIVLFITTQQSLRPSQAWLRLGSMWGILTLNAILLPNGFTPGFGVLWVALLPWFIAERRLYWMLIPSLAPYALMNAIEGFSVQSAILLITCATFQFFAMFAMSKARAEAIARQALATTHQQLLNAQQQLAEQAADAERVRIARDLHDSLGHHLTALVIQLQVAEYQSDAAHKPQLMHCHQLAKQLLQDIRHSVSQLRAPYQPHLPTQCRQLADNFPDLALDCQIPADFSCQALTNALFYRVCQEAMTNSVRHANAKQAWFQLWRYQQRIYCRYWDDGQCEWPINEGNGLQGMRERIEEAGGRCMFSLSPQHSLQIDIELMEDS